MTSAAVDRQPQPVVCRDRVIRTVTRWGGQDLDAVLI